MTKTAVIALGGNALTRHKQRPGARSPARARQRR
jgi:carbamate kinase